MSSTFDFFRDKHIEKDIAAEIMSMIIVKRLDEGSSPDVMNALMSERHAMYSGDKKTIEKILTVYAKEIRDAF